MSNIPIRKRENPRFLMKGAPSSFPTKSASNRNEILLVALQNFPTVTSSTPVKIVIDNIAGSDIRRLPVINPGNEILKGSIPMMNIIDFLNGERSNIIKSKHNGNLFKALMEPAGILIESKTITATLDTRIDDAIALMAKTGIGTLIIVDNKNRVRCILTEKIVLKMLAGKLTSVLVNDIMTKNPITTTSNATVGEALSTMLKKGFRRLPVIEEGKLVGIFTGMGLLRYLKGSGIYTLVKSGNINDLLSIKIDALMVKNPITITPDKTTTEAAKIMIEKGVGSLPVIEDGILKGILTERDFLKMLAQK
ncbi:MAG: CBS domain-containing protein [Thermoprotei archaeon]